MTKTELVKQIADKTELTQKDVSTVVSSFIDEITNALANGEKVQFPGFSTFETRARAARTGVNPATGDKIEIAASNVPAFKAGKALKDAVNK